MRKIYGIITIGFMLLLGAFAPFHSGGGPGSGLTITGITLSNNSFTAPASANTIVGAIAVQMTGGSFSGSLSLSGTDAVSFHIVGSNLETQASGTLCASPPCTYAINIVATQAGASGSPFTQAETITGSASVTVATKTFINTSASTMSAGQPTKMFGMAFKDGDICGGSAPQFLDGVTVQPFSAGVAGIRAYWNSGCLRFLPGIMLVPTFSVAGHGSHNVTVASGGTWPAASSRTLTELYAQNFVFNAPPGAPTDNNVTSSLSSWLDNPGTDTNNFEQVQWVDGAAGACWRVTTKMAHTQAGTADASMQTSHYVCSLNNSGGTLGGFRYLPVMRQPEFNAAGAPANRRTFATPNSGSPTSGVNWQVNAPVSGTTTVVPYWPFTAQAFTANSSINPFGAGSPPGGGSTTATNTYYQGAGGLQVIPAYFTGASLPIGITTNVTYFIGELQGDPNNFAIFSTGDGDSQRILSIGASGSGTVNPVVAIYPFGKIHFATQDGEYPFTQAGGSLTADTTLIDQQDQTYLQKTHLIPPYDLTLSGSSPSGLNSGAGGGAITDSSFAYNYNPYTIGSTTQGESAPGDHDDIGVLMADQVVDFYNQSFASEKLVRIDSFAAQGLTYDFKETSTHHTLDFTENGTYTGLKTSFSVSTDQFSGMCWGGVGSSTGYPNAAGFSQPLTPQNATNMGIDASYDHGPQFNAYAYLRTGELEHLDMLEDQAQQGVLTECFNAFPNPGASGITTASETPPYPAAGILTWYEGIGAQFRQMGWQSVKQQQAAMLAPYDPTHPTNLNFDGTQTGAYFNAVADGSAYFPYDNFNGGTAVWGGANSYVLTNGLWTMADIGNTNSLCPSVPCYQIDGPEWEKAFVYAAELIAVARGNTKAKLFLQAVPAVWWKHIGNTFGYWDLYHYYEQISPISSPTRGHTEDALASGFSSILNTTDSEFDVSMTSFWQGTGAVNPGWTSSGPPYFTTGSPQNSYTPKAGDAIQAWGGNFGNNFYVKPSVMAPNTPYYMTNIGAGTFDLTTVQSEALANNFAHRLVPTDTGSAMSIQIATYQPTAPAVNAAAFMNETVGIIRSIAGWAKALGADSGAGGFAAVVSDANARFANTTGVCSGSPCGVGGRYAVGSNGGFYQSSNGSTGGLVDPRYAVQDHFGP
jgi:hypothetical protein